MILPLQGLRLVDVSRQLPGLYCSMMLADLMDGSLAWNVFHAILHFITGKDPSRGETHLTGRFPCYSVYETDEALSEVGYSSAEIGELRKSGVV